MLIVNLLGILLIATIVWWFWLYKNDEVSMQENGITIIVENGIYLPSRIKLKANQSTTIRFLRKDATPCSATIQIPELEISEELTKDKLISIALPPMEKGEYPFHCQMQMYKGVLLVE